MLKRINHDSERYTPFQDQTKGTRGSEPSTIFLALSSEVYSLLSQESMEGG